MGRGMNGVSQFLLVVLAAMLAVMLVFRLAMREEVIKVTADAKTYDRENLVMALWALAAVVLHWVLP